MSGPAASAGATTIALDQACAGMVLAEALLDAHGGLLLPQGSTLSEASLASLRRRAIATCSVLGAVADPAQLARARAARLARLDQLFRHSGAAEAGATLWRLLITYREQQP